GPAPDGNVCARCRGLSAQGLSRRTLSTTLPDRITRVSGGVAKNSGPEHCVIDCHGGQQGLHAIQCHSTTRIHTQSQAAEIGSRPGPRQYPGFDLVPNLRIQEQAGLRVAWPWPSCLSCPPAMKNLNRHCKCLFARMRAAPEL